MTRFLDFIYRRKCLEKNSKRDPRLKSGGTLEGKTKGRSVARSVERLWIKMGPRGKLAIVARTVARLPTSEFHQWRLLLREIGVRGPIGLNELAAELDWNESNTPTPLFLSLFARTMHAICIGVVTSTSYLDSAASSLRNIDRINCFERWWNAPFEICLELNFNGEISRNNCLLFLNSKSIFLIENFFSARDTIYSWFLILNFPRPKIPRRW